MEYQKTTNLLGNTPDKVPRLLKTKIIKNLLKMDRSSRSVWKNIQY